MRRHPVEVEYNDAANDVGGLIYIRGGANRGRRARSDGDDIGLVSMLSTLQSALKLPNVAVFPRSS